MQVLKRKRENANSECKKYKLLFFFAKWKTCYALSNASVDVLNTFLY